MLHPGSPLSVTPWGIASDLCLDAVLASDLKVVNQKAWKPEEEPRAGAAPRLTFPLLPLLINASLSEAQDPKAGMLKIWFPRHYLGTGGNIEMSHPQVLGLGLGIFKQAEPLP